MKFFLGLLIGLVLAIAIAAGAAYYAFGDITDIGDRDKSADISKTYDLAGFDKIDVGGVYELNVRAGADFSVALSGPPQEMARVEASVEDGVLRLEQRRPERGERRWRNPGVTAEITLPALLEIDVSGVVDGNVTGVSADAFSIDLSGVGELDIEGVCNVLNARLSGVGALGADGFECKTVNVSVSGVGEASVYASEAVDARVSGIGAITVYGSPSTVEKSGGFLSDITIK